MTRKKSKGLPPELLIAGASHPQIGELAIVWVGKKWRDGTVVKHHFNKHGVPAEVTVGFKNGEPRRVPIFEAGAFFFPAKELIPQVMKDAIARYYNLVVVRDVDNSVDLRCQLLCSKCGKLLYVKMTSVEVAALYSRSETLSATEPSLLDGDTVIRCGCKRRTYDIEFEAY